MSIKISSENSTPISRLTLKILQFDVDLPFISEFLKKSLLFYICQKNRIIVVDSLTGSKVFAFNFSSESSIVAVASFLLPENSPGLYLVVENDDDVSKIFTFHVLSGRIIGGISIKNRVTTACTLKDFSTPKINCLNWHPVLYEIDHLLAIGTTDGHMFVVHIEFGSFWTETNLKILNSCSLDAVSLNSSFSIDFVDFLHSQSNFFWTDGCYSSTIDDDIVAVTSIKLINEADVIAVGFNFGSFLLVSLKNGRPIFCSTYDDSFCPVVHFLIQEPENDPRPTLFLWIVRNDGSTKNFDQSTVVVPTIFEFLQLSFRKKNFNREFGSLYEDIEICIPKFHWSPENCMEMIFCETLSIDRSISDRIDISNSAEMEEPDRSLVYFLWKTVSDDLQAVLFDINGWYHAQMPNKYTDRANKNGIFMAFHSFENHFREKTVTAARILTRTVQRCRDFNENEFAYYASNVGLKLILCTSETIFTCKADSLMNTAMETLTNLGPKLFLNPEDLVEMVEEVQFFTSMNIFPTNNKEVRWAIFDATLFSKRLKFLSDCLIEFRSDANLLTDFVDWSWNRVKKWKEKFQIICDRALDDSCSGISFSDKKLMHKSKIIFDDLLFLYNRCSGCVVNFVDDEERSRELLARRQAISLICLYVRMVLWVIDENLISLSDSSFFRHISSSRIGGQSNFIDKLTKILNEMNEFGTNRFEFRPKSFQDLLNVYLLPNIDESSKHSLIFYTLLDLGKYYSGKNEFEMISQICDRFCSNFFFDTKIAVAKLIRSFWHYDKGDLQIARNYFSEAVLRVDCLENAQFWLSFFPVSEISTTVLKLISIDSDLKSELLEEKLNFLRNFNSNESEDETLGDFYQFYINQFEINRFNWKLKNLSRNEKSAAEFLYLFKLSKFDEILSRDSQVEKFDEKNSICDVMKKKLTEILPRSKFDGKKIESKTFISNYVRTTMTRAAPLIVATGPKVKSRILSNLAKESEREKNLSPLKRQLPFEIVPDFSQPSTKKHKFSSSLIQTSNNSNNFEVPMKNEIGSNLMEFDDIRCLLETPTGSVKRQTESKIKSTTCAEKFLPVSILKTGMSPAKINQKSLVSAEGVKHFRFDLPPPLEESPSPSIPSETKIELPKANLLPERCLSLGQPTFDVSDSSDDEISFVKHIPSVSAKTPTFDVHVRSRPTIDAQAPPSAESFLSATNFKRPSLTSTVPKYPTLEASSPEVEPEDHLEKNYLSEESFVEEAPMKKLPNVEAAGSKKMVEFFTPPVKKSNLPSFDEFARNEMQSILKSLTPSRIQESTAPTKIFETPSNSPKRIIFDSSEKINFESQEKLNLDSHDKFSFFDSMLESIAGRVKISPRSSKPKISLSPNRESEKIEASSMFQENLLNDESTSSTIRYDLRRRPLRNSEPKRIATPAKPSEFAMKLQVRRRNSTTARRLSKIPKELLVKYAFSPPQTVEENANLIDESTLTDEPPINFVFSPPITRSRAKSEKNSNETGVQTTPFAEKLRRKAVRKNTRAVKRLTRSSLPENRKE